MQREVPDAAPLPADPPRAGEAAVSATRSLAERVEAGERTYRLFCAGCHGVDGKGDGYNVRQLGAARLRDLTSEASVATLGREAVLEAVRAGAGSPGDPATALMPGYAATFDAVEEGDLLDYLQALPARRFPPEENLSTSGEPRCQPCHASSGRKLFRELNCAGCHDVPGFARRTVGPDLSEVGTRYRKAWIYAFLVRPYNRHPLGYQPLEANRMPDFRMSGDERRALAEFLSRQRREVPLPVAPDLSDPNLVLAGEKMFRIQGCMACHEIDNYGGRIGPELSGAGLQIQRDWLHAWLRDPRALRPGSMMPKVELEPAVLDAIVAYLLSKRSKFPGVVNMVRLDQTGVVEGKPSRMDELEGVDTFPEPSTPAEGDRLAADGRRLFLDLGCVGCHPLAEVEDDPVEPVGPSLATAGIRLRRDWLYSFLLSPTRLRPRLEARMPHLHLTDSEAQSVMSTLDEIAREEAPALASSIASAGSGATGASPGDGRRSFVERDCHSCHAVADESFGPVRSPYYVGDEQDRRARWAPDLAHARRLHRGAILHQIRDPESLWSESRMPKIPLSEGEIEAIADWLNDR